MEQENSHAKDYVNYFLLKNKAYFFTIPLSFVIAIILLSLCEIFLPTLHPRLPQRLVLYWVLKIWLETLIVVVATSISGWMVGGLAVFVVFHVAVFMGQQPLHPFVLLLIVVLTDFFLSRGWYTRVITTVASFFINILFMALAVNFIWWVSGHENYLLGTMLFFIIPCSVGSTFCYIFVNLIPDHIASLFYTTSYSSAKMYKLRLALKRHKIYGQIDSILTTLIVLSAVFLIMCAHGWSGAIFVDRVPTIDPVMQNIRMHEFSEFFIYMIIEAIPGVLLCVYISRHLISNPLMLMSLAIGNEYKQLKKYADEEPIACEKFRGSRIVSSEENELISDIHLKDLNIHGANEIGMVYTALSASFEALKNQIAYLEREKQLENNLEVANAANKAKSNFLSNMSHEIRTPINAVLGFDEMILRKVTDTEIKEYAQNIQAAGKNLLSLINDILDFSKIEAGKMEIICANYELSSLINDLINMISVKAKEKNLTLNVNVDETLPHLLYGDEIRIKQCILNILTNAVKYTNVGSVTLSISGEILSQNRIRLEVHIVDTGIGIKEEDKSKLFEAFQRIEEERNKTIEGTGLGINIVQQLLNLMGSCLNVNSEYGKGSDFWFSLEQEIVSSEPIGNFAESYKKSLEATACYRESFHAPNAHVLVVDDTKLNLTVFCDLLKDTELQIDTATSGEETLELVTRKKYDILFIDHRMPGMDGIETLEVMKTLDENLNKDTPCIALTANAVSGAKQMYLDAGFTDYFTKPIDSAKLEKLLIKYLPQEKVSVFCAARTPEDEEKLHVVEKFSIIEGIDAATALENCGSANTLTEALVQFAEAIDEKSSLIEQYADAKDFKNYTVLVHALKSTSRLIGAKTLSSDAAYLESCGDRSDALQIEQKTPALLLLYRSYKEKLAQFVEEVQNDKKEDDEQKEEMSISEFNEAVNDLRECAEAFDFDTADQIVEMINQYNVPKEKREFFEKVKKLVHAADQNALILLLSPKNEKT